MNRPVTARHLFAVALALVVVALAGWVAWHVASRPSPILRAMLDDPMAQYVPPAAAPVDAVRRDEGISLGKPSRALVSRAFQLQPGQGRPAYAAARRAARAAGWAPTDLPPGTEAASSFTAVRTMPGNREVTLSIDRSGPPSTTLESVRIQLASQDDGG